MIGAAELRLLRAIAARAGEAIMAVYADGSAAAWTKADESPLTAADLRSDEIIARGLHDAFPGVYVLSEESASEGTLQPGQPFFLVDPLDGTKEFLKRNGEFTVNIAFIEQGVPVAGVVAAPALGETFFAAQGQGGWKADAAGERPLRAGARAAGQPLRVIGSRSHGGDALQAWLARLEQPHEFVAAGSSLKFCRLAEGAADAYPRLGPTSQWDTAAGQAVLEAAGGVVLDGSGRPLRYGPQRPILNPDFLALGDPHLSVPPLGSNT